VTVFTPAPIGGISNAKALTFNNPVPTTTSMSPTTVNTGRAAFTLTVNGSGFNSSSVVQWNEGDRTTTYVSDTQLTASIPAADIATAGTVHVTVSNPSPGGGTSTVRTFTISDAPPPKITSITPTTLKPGGAAFTLTVTGSGFVSDSVVQWNAANRTTTFVSSTQLKAAIPAEDIATAGTAQVTVFTPAPIGGISNAKALTFI